MRSLLAAAWAIAAAGLLLSAQTALAAGTVTRNGTEFLYADDGNTVNKVTVTVVQIPIGHRVLRDAGIAPGVVVASAGYGATQIFGPAPDPPRTAASTSP